MIRPKLIQHQK